MNITTNALRKVLKLVASLPKGDEDRRAILSSLKSITVVDKVATDGVPREFKHEDYYGWAGAEGWGDAGEPWIIEMPFKGNISRNLHLGQMGPGYAEEFGIHTQQVAAIADSQGIGIYFSSNDGDQGPMFHKNTNLEAEEAEGALKAVARYLKGGKLPPGYKHDN